MSEEKQEEPRVRRMIASWIRADEVTQAAASPPAAGSGLDIPPTSARRVIDATRGVIADALGPMIRPGIHSPLRPIAEALLLEQHPSVGTWTTAERSEVLDWLTLLLDELGEPGVERMVVALNAGH